MKKSFENEYKLKCKLLIIKDKSQPIEQSQT
jgi:hypothetical protein